MEFMLQSDPLLSHEFDMRREGFLFVAGVDEAGRGCIAGPVVAAAAMFTDLSRVPDGVYDSKQLTHARRMEVREALLAEPSFKWSVAEVRADEIDASDILRCTWMAMAKAVAGIDGVQFALVDGRPVKGLGVPSKAIVKGDSKSAGIAAASIIAKTHRDMLMERLAEDFPGYGFEIHKGYCTEAHVEALRRLGPCPQHRISFEPVKSIVNPPEMTQPPLL